MKAGDEVELNVEDHPHKGERGLVARIDWRDSERAYVVFHKRRVHLPTGWWPTVSFTVVGHMENDVFSGFLEALEWSSLQYVSVAEIHAYGMKKDGHIALNFEVEALLRLLFPDKETNMLPRDEEKD